MPKKITPIIMNVSNIVLSFDQTSSAQWNKNWNAMLQMRNRHATGETFIVRFIYEDKCLAIRIRNRDLFIVGVAYMENKSSTTVTITTELVEQESSYAQIRQDILDNATLNRGNIRKIIPALKAVCENEVPSPNQEWVLLIFMISEAARFESARYAVKHALLDKPAIYALENWKKHADILKNWDTMLTLLHDQKKQIEVRQIEALSKGPLTDAQRLTITKVMVALQQLELIKAQTQDIMVGDTTYSTVVGSGYNVIDSSYIRASKVRASIVDMTKLPPEYFSITDLMESHSIFSFGEDVQETMTSFNATLKANINYFLFSGGLEAEFDLETQSKTEYTYARNFTTALRRKEELSDNGYKKYLRESFVKDLNDMENIDALFDNYGTHMIKRVNIGGRLDFSFTYHKTSAQNKEQAKLAIEAGYSDILKCRATADYQKETKALVSRSKTVINTVGGSLFDMQTLESFATNYPKWLDSISEKPELWTACDIAHMGSLVPIWTFCNTEARSNEIEQRYFDLLYQRRKELQPLAVLVGSDIFIAMGESPYKAMLKCPPKAIMISKNIHKGITNDYAFCCYRNPVYEPINAFLNNLIVIASSDSTAPTSKTIVHNNKEYKGAFLRDSIGIVKLQGVEKKLYLFAAHITIPVVQDIISGVDILYGDEQLPQGWEYVCYQNTRTKVELNQSRAQNGKPAYMIFTRAVNDDTLSDLINMKDE